MATVLEDEDLIAQAQERERARLEEEALILAYQQQQRASLPPPVWAGSPEAAIDAFNAQPGIVGAPTIIGSEQYNQELARAQRGSGFIAADVGPMGNVITPGYDPATDPRALAAEREAINFQRQQLYGQLLRDGSTAAEAYRFANSRYPDIKSAAGLIRAETVLARTQPMQPEIRDLGGVQMVRTGPQSWRPLTPSRAVPGRVPPVVRAAEDNLKDEIASLRRQLTSTGLGGLPLEPEKAAALKAEIAVKEQQRVDLLNRPEFSPNVDQVGFSRMRPAWEAAGRAPVVAAPADLTADLARDFLKAAGGDKSKARQLALDAGYRL